MRINILLGPFYPIPPTHGLAVERMQFALAREYVARGCEVTMISRRFGDRAHDEVVDGVRHIRVASGDEPAGKLVYRWMDLLYVLRACRVMPAADVTVTNSVIAPLLTPRRCGAISVSVGRFPKGQMGLYRRAARLLAPSSAVARAIVRQSPRMAARVRVIPNPIASEFASAARGRIAGEAAPERGRELMFVGRVAREKGVHLLVSAFRRIADAFPDWRLSIVGPAGHVGGGDGASYLRDLQADAAPLGDRVRFEGAIYDPSILADRLLRAGVFVYPSIAEMGEAFGVAPVEAMACGCPVVVSDLDCFRAFVDAETGVTFDHRAEPVARLAEACARLMSSPEDRARLGQAGLMASQRFFPDRVADLVMRDFESLIRARTGGA